MTSEARSRAHFTYTPIADTTHVTIQGQLVVENRQGFKQAVLDEIDRGQRHFVLDCRECGYMDSSGLGVLVTISKAIRTAGGTLRLANLNDDLLTLFELTRMDTLFVVGGLTR